MPLQTLHNWIKAEKQGREIFKIKFDSIEAGCLINLISEKLNTLTLGSASKAIEKKAEIKMLNKLRTKLLAK